MPPAGGPQERAEREGPGGPGRGRKGEIRETSHSGRTRQTGSGQGGRSRQGGARSGAPGVGGGFSGGRGRPPRRLRTRVEGWGVPRPVRSGSAELLVTRHPRPRTPTGAQPRRRELRPRHRPRPEPQIPAGYWGRVRLVCSGRLGAPRRRARSRAPRRGRPERPRVPRAPSGQRERRRAAPRGPAPRGLCPPPARPAPSFPQPPPPPGSSTQTFRPARSLLHARRLPLRPGSFRTFRLAPSPRPPFPDPPRGSAGPVELPGRSAPPSSDQVSPADAGRRPCLGEVVGWLVLNRGKRSRGAGSRAIVHPELEPRIWVPGSLEGRGRKSLREAPPTYPPPATGTSRSAE